MNGEALGPEEEFEAYKKEKQEKIERELKKFKNGGTFVLKRGNRIENWKDTDLRILEDTLGIDINKDEPTSKVSDENYYRSNYNTGSEKEIVYVVKKDEKGDRIYAAVICEEGASKKY